MSTNQITDTGAIQIGEAIKVNLALRVLDISNNILSSKGVLVLNSSLERNSTIKVVYITTVSYISLIDLDSRIHKICIKIYSAILSSMEAKAVPLKLRESHTYPSFRISSDRYSGRGHSDFIVLRDHLSYRFSSDRHSGSTWCIEPSQYCMYWSQHLSHQSRQFVKPRYVSNTKSVSDTKCINYKCKL